MRPRPVCEGIKTILNLIMLPQSGLAAFRKIVVCACVAVTVCVSECEREIGRRGCWGGELRTKSQKGFPVRENVLCLEQSGL